jgi:hypothetical protein
MGLGARVVCAGLLLCSAACEGDIGGGRALETRGGATAADGGARSWMSYHWPRRATPIAIRVGDSLTTDPWRETLTRVLPGWTASTIVRAQRIAGEVTDPKDCTPGPGRVEVCNAEYGLNGWLGLATIWVSGDEIQNATVRLNDSYFATSDYDDRYARQHVLCQELGHTLGLDHQRTEVSCMNDIEGLKDVRYVGPGRDDFTLLARIYTPGSAAAQALTVAGPGDTRAYTFIAPAD